MSKNSTEKYINNTLFIPLTSKYLFYIIKYMRYTFKDFKAEYPDDEACLKAVLENRYGETCPRCGTVGVKWHPVKGRKTFVCSECDKHISPLADTIFRKSETSLWNWFYAIYLFSVSKNGVSAKELERHLGVTYKTAWRMAKQIRLLMQQEADLLTGTVEIDETYIGGRRKQFHARDNKIAVVGMVENQGSIKAITMKKATAGEILPYMNENIDPLAIIHTDESSLYARVKDYFIIHNTVDHGLTYVGKDGTHTNTIEGFWSQLKRSINGTYHCVSPKYLQSYVNEFSYRYNYRGVPVFPLLIERAGKHV
jgi:transposase